MRGLTHGRPHSPSFACENADFSSQQGAPDLLKQARVLVVDDEADIVDLISYNLKKAGFDVLTASNGTEALAIASKELPDLVVLDVMMPGMNGFEVCKVLRSQESTSPIATVFLTAKTREVDQLKGLELGADDYVPKPVSPRILVARIQNILRRREEHTRQATSVETSLLGGEMVANRQNYTIRIADKEVFFPKKEFELVVLLASNPGKVYSRDELLAKVWGQSVQVVDRTVDVHVSKVREKLGTMAQRLETVKGAGYRFTSTSEK